MSGKTKKISINPDFFKINTKQTKKKEKKKKREKMKSFLKPNKLKENLINKIREHKKKQKNSKEIKENEKKLNFVSNFQNSINYLEQIAEKKKKKKKRKTKKKAVTEDNENIVTIKPQNNIVHEEKKIEPSLVSNEMKENYSKITPDPPWGILKNGTKPLYSQYKKKTLKNTHGSNNIKIKIDENKNTTKNISEFDNRREKLSQLKENFKELNKQPEIHVENIKTPIKNEIFTDSLEKIKKEPIIQTIPVKKKKKKLTRKLYLGKNKKDKTVSILIKNKQTRKEIKGEHDKLKKTSIHEIKKYLKKHNLIKIGSPAPENIIRNIYENAKLSGEIYNKNPEILLHNYLQ